MRFENKVMQCSDCGTIFTFTAAKQEFFTSVSFTNQPECCVSCRRATKEKKGSSDSYSNSYSSRR